MNPILSHPREARASLDGEWLFRLDPEDRGIDEQWFGSPDALSDRVSVPGCWQGQGKGGDGTDMVWDFRLEARVFRATYRGTGWYGRVFRLPDGWAGRRTWVALGGVHPSAELWLNGKRLGEHGQPFVPFAYEITDLLEDENFLAVRVHERDRILGLAYSWQGNWSGLYRGVELTSTGEIYIDSIAAHPDPDTGVIRLRASIGGDPGKLVGATLSVEVRALPDRAEAPNVSGTFPVSGPLVEAELTVASPRLWSPDDPALYRMDTTLLQTGSVQDARSERIGFVKLSTAGKHILINDAPYYLRGTGEFLSNPETGSPDTDRGRWRRKLSVLRSYGYNYVRCQSFAPAPEYFDAADEVGLLVQSEMGALGAWGGNDQWHIYAWPQPAPSMREALKEQWDLVVARDVNHPSAGIYCMSNELGKQTDYPRLAWQCYRDTRRARPSALILWTDGGCNEELPGDFVNDEASVDRATAKPVVQHEFRWWSSYPDVRAMASYDGAVRPFGAQIALEAAERHGIKHVLPRAAANSQRLQFLEAKGKMERCRRDNPTLAGICHFNAMDANLSPQGVVDELYRRKYADADLWLQSNGDTVVLSSLGFPDRNLVCGDELAVAFWVSDFSHPPLREPICEWELRVGETTAASGSFSFTSEPFRTRAIGECRAVAPTVLRPSSVKLIASIRDGTRRFSNSWDLWVFPPDAGSSGAAVVYGQPRHTWLKSLGAPGVGPGALDHAGPSTAVFSEVIDAALVRHIENGGRVILCAAEGLVRPFRPKFGFTEGQYFFTPPANYPPYEDGHDGTIVENHPMLGSFPHEGFADLQFYRVMEKAPPLELEALGMGKVDPVIRVMHSYPVARPLAYLAEAAVGKGGVILSALDLDQALPEARHLARCIAEYASGGQFEPRHRLGGRYLSFLTRVTRPE